MRQQLPRENHLYPFSIDSQDASTSASMSSAASSSIHSPLLSSPTGAPERGLPEFQLYVEEEPLPEVLDGVSPDYTQSTDMHQMEESTSSGKIAFIDGPLDETTQTDILAALGHKQSHDKQVERFQQRIQRSPDQCVRYCQFQNEAVLWASSHGQPTLQNRETEGPEGVGDACSRSVKAGIDDNQDRTDTCLEKETGARKKNNDQKLCIPRCHCGSRRLFEFQVLPQLLYFMEVENRGFMDFDWDTIAVFTCPQSCCINRPSLVGAKGSVESSAGSGANAAAFSVEEAWVQTMTSGTS